VFAQECPGNLVQYDGLIGPQAVTIEQMNPGPARRLPPSAREPQAPGPARSGRLSVTRWREMPRPSRPLRTVGRLISAHKALARPQRYALKVSDDVLTLEALRRRRTEILRVARRRRAHRIAVFGSVARGEAQHGSDVDLLVDFEPGASLLDQVGLFQDLEELLGVGVDVVSRSGLKARDDHIRTEAVDL
jgi:uncharacterized protein